MVRRAIQEMLALLPKDTSTSHQLAYQEALSIMVNSAADLCSKCIGEQALCELADPLMELAMLPAAGRVARAAAVRASARAGFN